LQKLEVQPALVKILLKLVVGLPKLHQESFLKPFESFKAIANILGYFEGLTK